jgi:hypothetical protein
MTSNFECPICSNNFWEKCKSFTYEPFACRASALDNIQYRFTDLRRHILSQLWFQGQSEIVLTSLRCKSCGFMCYTPRPSVNDLSLKYEFLNSLPENLTTFNPSAKRKHVTDKRAARLFKLMMKGQRRDDFKILDYGGKFGGLLKYFVGDQLDCYLIDYNIEVESGIKRLGSTFNEMPPDMLFNVIICSHVLEHVVDPIDTLKQFLPFLKSNGMVYVEVPSQIWQGIPIRSDPVTHVNFFSKDSFRTAILRSGFSIHQLKESIEPYGTNHKRVIWAVISKGDRLSLMDDRTNRSVNFLRPTLVQKLRKKIENRWIKWLNKRLAR